MNILHIGKYFPPFFGGMENYLHDLVHAQKRQGLTPTVLVHRAEPSLRTRQDTVGQQGEAGEPGEQGEPGGQLLVVRVAMWLRLLFTPISPTFPLVLRRLLREQDPDLLHLHMPNVSVFWCLFSPRARRRPWVVHWHADVLASTHSLGLRVFYTLYRPFERAVLKRASAIIVTSPDYLDSSATLAPFRERCRVVPLGLDPTPLAIEARRPAAEAAPLQLLAVGRFTYYKGFEHLLKALPGAPDWALTLVGTGELEPNLRALVGELGLTDRVTIRGRVEAAEMPALFDAADCLCLPSIERTEAFGMVLLEAMCSERATLATTVSGSGMGWVVDDGVTGLLVEPGDHAALTAALVSLASDRDKLRSMGQAGRLKFEQCFHIDVSAAGVQVCYADVAA